MKNIISILFILIMVIVKSQNYPQPNSNYIDPHADKFMGTWKWQDGSNSLTLIMKKENILLPFPDNVHADWVIGFHKFVSNGSISEDTTMYSSTNYIDKKKYYSSRI